MTDNRAKCVSTQLRVVPFEPARAGQWADYVQRSSAATLAHSLAWKRVVEETFGHEPVYLMADRSGTVAGILPMFLVQSRLFGRFLVTSPFLTFGGIAADDEQAASALVEAAIRTARDRNADYLELRHDRQWPGLPYTKSKYYTLVLDLTPGENDLWQSALHPSARRNVRKARRAGVQIVSGRQYLDAFVEINARNMRRLGTPPHGRRFFRKIVDQLPDSVLLIARAGGAPIGGTLLVPFKDTFHMPWVASLREYFPLRPNNLVYWEAVRTAVQHGCRFFDFGRSKAGSGTFRFKSQYGARPVPLCYQYFLHRARTVPDVDPDHLLYKPMIAVWRRLPMPVVRRLGPRIIAAIP